MGVTDQPDRTLPDRQPQALRELIEGQLRALVLDTPFPCLGARSAVRGGGYLFNVYADLRNRDSVLELARDLRQFADTRHRLGDFYSFVASFVEPRAVLDEARWEREVWSALQLLHDADTEPWDARWSTDPAEHDFALSIAGCGQLVVTLYPGAPRFARRFAWPTLVFNPLEQDRANFPDEESFLRFRNLIRVRDVRLQGQVNPALPRTPHDPQAPGFAGVAIGADWRCPLIVRPHRTSDSETPDGWEEPEHDHR